MAYPTWQRDQCARGQLTWCQGCSQSPPCLLEEELAACMWLPLWRQRSFSALLQSNTLQKLTALQLLRFEWSKWLWLAFYHRDLFPMNHYHLTKEPTQHLLKRKRKSSPFPFSPKSCESVLWHWEWKAVRNGWAFWGLTGTDDSGNNITYALAVRHLPDKHSGCSELSASGPFAWSLSACFSSESPAVPAFPEAPVISLRSPGSWAVLSGL